MGAAIERLPQELLSSIIDMVETTPRYRCRYVTVSRRWQRTIEPPLFKRFRLNNNSIDAFATLFRPSESHRKALVGTIFFDALHPLDGGVDPHQKHEADCHTFSDLVHKLFKILETFNEDEGVQRGAGVHLVISISRDHSPRSFFRYVKISNQEKLPILSCVSGFSVWRVSGSRFLDPVSMALVVSKFRDLRSCWLSHDGRRHEIDIETEKRHHAGIANALSAYTGSMEEFTFSTYPRRLADETIYPPNLIPATSQLDPLSLEIHNLIQRARISQVTLHPSTRIAPEFFWPYDGVNLVPNTPFWPNLRRIDVDLSPITPGGSWYFLPDERIATYGEFAGENRVSTQSPGRFEKLNSNTFRSIPNPATMNPLLIALSRVIRHAPLLESIELAGSRKLQPKFVNKRIERAFNLYYYAAGVHGRRAGTTPVDKRRMIWWVNDWRPDKHVVRHFEDALGPKGAMIYTHNTSSNPFDDI